MTRILSDEVLPPGMALLPQEAGRGTRREKIFCGRGASAFDPGCFGGLRFALPAGLWAGCGRFRFGCGHAGSF